MNSEFSLWSKLNLTGDKLDTKKRSNQNFRKFEKFGIIFAGLSYDVPSGSDIAPCIKKIGKPLVVHRFSGNVVKLLF